MRKVMGMINCEDVLARLFDFLDGELPAHEEAAVQEHLEMCKRCYPQYDFQRAYLEFTRRIQGRQYASAEFRRRLFQTLLEQDLKNRGA